MTDGKAAERLRSQLTDADPERIRTRVNGLEVAEAHFGTIVGTFNNIRHILDEEAAR